MTTKVHSQHGSVPIAKLLAVEAQVGKLTSEMEKLIHISTQHGTRIKELIVASSNSVSQVEMMSTVTTTRFQHMNDLKALKSSLQAKYEGTGGAASADFSFNAEADSKDSKNSDMKFFEIQNEMSNASFKTNMEMNKLKMELKASKKDYEDLKRFVTVMETKLSVFIQDAKDSGINTSIEMADMPEITRTSAPRRASILSMDGVTVGFGGGGGSSHPSTPSHPGYDHAHQQGGFFPNSPAHFPGAYPGGYPGQHPVMFPHFPGFPGHPQPGAHPPTHTPFTPGTEALPEEGEHFPLPVMDTPSAPAIDPVQFKQLQQLQLLYQQQVYHQHHLYMQHQHAIHSTMPITDSGMSTPGGARSSTANGEHRHSVVGDLLHNTPTGGGGSDHPTAHTDTTGAAPDTWQSVAHRIIHPSSHHNHHQHLQHMYPQHMYPHPQHTFPGGAHAASPAFPFQLPPNLFSHTMPHGMGLHPSMTGMGLGLGLGEDPEAALIASLAVPALSKEERYYRNQYRAMKELILATMDCKDISAFEPDCSHLHTTATTITPAAPAVGSTSEGHELSTAADAKPSGGSPSKLPVGTAAVAMIPQKEPHPSNRALTAEEAEDALKKRVTMHLRHQNRDLFRNMRRVKEVEGIAANYADFCVNNAVNVIDGAAYDKFKDILMAAELSRFHEKSLTQTTVEVQTEEFAPSDGRSEKSRLRSPSFLSGSRRRSSKFRGGDSSGGGFGGGSDSFRNRTRSRGDSFGSQSDGEQSRGNSAGGPGISGGGGGGGVGNSGGAGPVTDTGGGLSGIGRAMGGSGSPALEPPRPMLLTLKELRETHEDDSEAEDIAEILDMELASTAAPLDFGDAISPALFSSKGRKATICEFSGKVLKDPALEFLDTSFEDLPEESSFSDPSPVMLHLAAGGSRTSSFRQSSFKSNLDSAYYGVDAAPPASRPTTAAATADIAQLKASMIALMDKKLLKLYQGLDDRWKGLDETNVSILHKLRKFQDVIVSMNEDSQKLLMSNQVLAGRIAKLDGRLFEALEPMYFALETHKDSTERLEGLMMELAKTIQQQQAAASFGKVIDRPVWKDGEVPELKTVMAAMKPEQLPIDVILKNSHQRQQQLPHPHNSPCAHSKTNAYQGANHSDALHSGAIDSAGEYNVLELDGSRPARLMSELELDEVLRQLRQYAGMYQDMMHNYQAIFKRLKEEDAHKGGNAALKKPYLTGLRQVRTPSRVMNQPQHHSSSSNQQHDGNTDGQPGLVPHPPGQLVFQVPTAGENTRFTDSPGFNSADSGDNVEYSSPQRVVYQTSQPPGKQFPLSKKDVLSLLERSDLSSNIEIIRIKNELARLKNALSQDNRRTPSPNRQRGQAPPTTFPSLFCTLGGADFATAVRNQSSSSPTGAALRSSGPPGGAGFRPGSPRNALPSPTSATTSFVVSTHAHATVPPAQPTTAVVLPSLAIQNTIKKSRPVMQDSLEELQSLSREHPVFTAVLRQEIKEASGLDDLPAEGEGTVEAAATDNYIVGGVLDDENGLDQKSLSAYEYLTHPHTSQSLSQSANLGETDPLDAPSQVFHEAAPGAIRGTSAELATSSQELSHIQPAFSETRSAAVVTAGESERVLEAGTVMANKAKVPVELVYDARSPEQVASLLQPTSTGSGSGGVATKWGSAASIRSSAIQPRTVAALLAVTQGKIPHNPLLAPQVGSSTDTTISAAPRSGSAKNKAVRKTIAPGATTVSTAQARLENSSREGVTRTNPSDTIRKMEVLLRADAIINGEIAPFSATGSVKTSAVSVPTPPVKARPIATAATLTPYRKIIDKGAEQRDIRQVERDAKVWQKDYSSVEREFLPDYNAEGPGVANVTNRADVKAAAEDALHLQGGSVDSVPLNIRRNLGENAFD